MKAIFLIFLGTFALLSCKKEETLIDKKPKISSENLPKSDEDGIKYKLRLPDTVLVNQPYKAVIEFESDFDTIVDPIQVNIRSTTRDTTKTRVIVFYNFEPTKTPMQPHLVLKDSTLVLNKSFEVDNIVFKEVGDFFYCGFIKDVIMYNHYNEGGIRDTVHFEERKQNILKKVVVVE